MSLDVSGGSASERSLERAREHCFVDGVGDAGEALCVANQVYGIAKIHYVQDKLGLPPDATFVGAPDATVTRNETRWRQGFGYGGRIRWTGDFAVLDIKSNACGMIVASTPEPLRRENLVEAALAVKNNGLRVDGIDVDFDLDEFPIHFRPLAAKYNLRWRLERSDKPHRLAVFVSKYDHCLADLLYRHQAGELACEIPIVISNHTDSERWAKFHHIEYIHIPVDNASKAAAEKQQLDLCAKHNIDLIVMARYMQVLSGDFIAHHPHSIINVHHSFLPAFSGAKPYHRAFERGVKLIGATSHYATEVLDDGPIIDCLLYTSPSPRD